MSNQINDGITLAEFDELCAKAVAVKAKLDELEAEAKVYSKELEAAKGSILSYMKHFEKEKYVHGGATFYTQQRFTVSMPKSDEQRQEFFDYLKEREIFEETITVHSQTLNSFYKSEMEKAVEEGNVDFKIPGLEEPKLVEILVIRKN